MIKQMRRVQILNETRPLTARLEAGYAESFGDRLRGLTFRRTLPREEGLLLVQGRPTRLDGAIHMLGVWFVLGIVWLDDQRRVIDTRLARPWRLLYVPRAPAQFVLEISGDRLREFAIDDRLRFEDVPTT